MQKHETSTKLMPKELRLTLGRVLGDDKPPEDVQTQESAQNKKETTNPPANRNGLLELRARTATYNKTRRRPAVATRRKLKYYSTNPPANRNGLLELRARTATYNKTRRRPVVATRRKLKYYSKVSYAHDQYECKVKIYFNQRRELSHQCSSESSASNSSETDGSEPDTVDDIGGQEARSNQAATI
ncbi:hypothetical protein EVAR_41577_1 [Eumeta japonica]|uniref:Uncharacterized protein n=1 Tax=Eumeta variegata TaxID=151549 RepID=A0A4C1Y2R8_EUMVA|nr:hypothetical protein EVAR_41577_1 [Eumeta japonica]